MKKKLANILRRWANKLSPTIGPDKIAVGFQVETYEVKRFQGATHYSRQEIELIERDPAIKARIDFDRRRELLNDLALTMYTAGAITFHTEPEPIPGGHEATIATVYATIQTKKLQQLWNP